MRLNPRVWKARVARPAVALSALLAGCAPALDWREVRAPGSAAMALMPCKPGAQQRQLPLAGTTALVTLQACSAGGLTWALVSADLADPALVGPVLQELSAASARKLAAQAPAGHPFAPPGSTPNPNSQRFRAAGRLPDGGAALLESAVFSHGTWVFQATVLGEKADSDAAEAFFGSLRVTP